MRLAPPFRAASLDRSPLVISSALGIGLLATAAHAALPVYFATNGVNYESPSSPGRWAINNAGIAIGQGIAPGNSGYTAFSWQPRVNPTLLVLKSLDNTNVYVTPAAINDAGVIVGTSQLTTTPGVTRQRAVKYATPGSPTPTELPAPQPSTYSSSSARLINDLGAVAGNADSTFSQGEDTGNPIARWSANNGTAAILSAVSTDTKNHWAGTAVAMNNANVIVGTQKRFAPDGSSLGTRSVRWTGSNTGVELAPINTQPSGFADTTVVAVNNSGVAAGGSAVYSGFSLVAQRVVRWNTGGIVPTPLDFAGNADLNGLRVNVAVDMNEAGTVAGAAALFSADSATYRIVPVRWNAGGTAATELDSLGILPNPEPGVSGAVPVAINNGGAILGYADNVVGGVSQGFHGVVWPANSTTPIDLSTLITNAPGTTFIPDYVTAISDTGFVTGNGTFTPAGGGATQTRLFSMMVPQAGTYGQGDANLDTRINFDDLLLLAQHYGQSNAGQALNVADFDLNGTVNFDDLLALGQHYSGASSFEADWALAQSLVPEPGALAAVGLSLCARRRVFDRSR